jgi:hypothetical protein
MKRGYSFFTSVKIATSSAASPFEYTGFVSKKGSKDIIE